MSDAASFPTWVNGQPAAGIGVDNRGLAYGDGVFETMLLRRGNALCLPLHRQRLARGCERLGIETDAAALWASVADYCNQTRDQHWCVVKLMLTRRASGRGYTPLSADADVILTAAPAIAPWDRPQWQRGAHLARLTFTCANAPALAGIKHLNRLEQVLAAAEVAQRGVDEGIVGDADGVISGCSAANLFYCRGTMAYRIVHDGAGVAGTMAEYLGELLGAENADFAVHKDCAFAQLESADEVFCCNAVRGIWPVVAIDDRAFPIGPITRSLQTRLRGEISD